MGFPGGSAGKESTCNAGELGLIPGLGISPGEGKGYPLQYSGLANSMDCIVHGVTKSWTQLSDFHFQTFQKKKTPSAPHVLLRSDDFIWLNPSHPRTSGPCLSNLMNADHGHHLSEVSCSERGKKCMD